MTTVRQETRRSANRAVPAGQPAVDPVAPSEAGRPVVPPGPQPGLHAVADHQRRLVREQLLVVAVLVLALAATLGLLAAQWLAPGSTPSTAAPLTTNPTGGST